MQLMIAIVQDEDADRLSKRLNSAGIRSTRLNTIGGFLARGNVTVLAGIEEAQVEGVLEIIRKTCHTRKRYINATPTGTEPAHLALTAPAIPLEVLVGGATVFWFPVARFARLAGSPQPDVNNPSTTSPAAGAQAMNLVLTIVQSEDADAVTRALIAANYRVTRMNTAGGFFRRGNVTLLAGVEEAQVDDVMRIINESCRQRTEANPVKDGMPMYGATVFVLEAGHFQRI